MGLQQMPEASSRCVLCPAGCELRLVPTGPDLWRSEFPQTDSAGLCPRGGAIGELVCHRRRILQPLVRGDGPARAVDPSEALEAVLDEAGDREIILCMDGNVPFEQMTAAAGCCDAWPQARLCLVIEPSDEQLLLGTEASGADYLADDQLAECDGFVVVGNAFAANPMCSRGVFERRLKARRTPIVVIDPGGGTAVKFATHRLTVAPGMEAAALAELARSVDVTVPDLTPACPTCGPSAAAAGKAIDGCKRLAVLVAAEYGRCAAWRQVGYLAGLLAKARAGGVAAQTSGANALAAVRLGPKLKALSPAEGISQTGAVRVALGCDILGMLGWQGRGVEETGVIAAAAALPNCTTEAAAVVLPTSMVGEWQGTYLLSGAKAVKVDAAIRPPAGVASPAGLISALADLAGISAANCVTGQSQAADRLDAPVPETVEIADPPGPVLLMGRQAAHGGCGELTAHGAWQSAAVATPELRICPDDAHKMNVPDLREVDVRVDGRSCRARVRISPELSPGVMVLPEGYCGTRALAACRIDRQRGTIEAAAVHGEVVI